MAKPHDDSVLSNIAYPLSAFLSWGDWNAFSMRILSGLYLGLASGLFHTNLNNRDLQELDIHATLTYTSVVSAIVYQSWSVFAWILPIIAAIYYLIQWRNYDSKYHVIGWSLFAVPGLIIQTGIYSLIPLVLAIGGRLIKATDEEVHGPLHSLWHVLTAGAAGSSDYLILNL